MMTDGDVRYNIIIVPSPPDPNPWFKAKKLKTVPMPWIAIGIFENLFEVKSIAPSVLPIGMPCL